MTREKPAKVWQWLLLIAPGAVSVALTAFGKLALSRADEITPSIIGVLLIPLLSAGAAFYFARRAGNAGKIIGVTLLYTLGLIILNFSIALGGCAAMNPHLDLR
jgi:hypothetical protein